MIFKEVQRDIATVLGHQQDRQPEALQDIPTSLTYNADWQIAAQKRELNDLRDELKAILDTKKKAA